MTPAKRATPAGSSARLAAQAKVNLFLRVLGREPDGYHQLETLFQRISLADDVAIAVDVRGRALDCRGADVGPMERNLAWRAATEFADATGWPNGFAIELTKEIPVGGGLGGGSADAGAVLRILNALAPSPLSDEVLFGIARSLGADVPFLASSAPTAVGLLRGDVIVACPPPHRRDVILLVPPFSVSSRDAFGWYADAHSREPRKASRLATPASGIALATVEAAIAAREQGATVNSTDYAFSWREVASLAGNDLQPVVVERHPEVGRAVALLRAAGAPLVQMTGSGSAVFGIFPNRPMGGVVALPPGFTMLHAETLTRVADVQLVS